MADTIYTFDPTPANNTSLDTIPYGPNQLYHNQIDNWFRALGSKVAQYVDDQGGIATTAGTANAQTVTLASAFAANAAGHVFTVKIGAGLTNTSTTVNLNVNSIGNVRVKVNYDGLAGDPIPGDIKAGAYATFLDNGTNFILLNPQQRAPYPSGHLYGLTLSNNGSDATNDIDIAIGTARSSDDSANIDLTSALTKQLDAVWAVGTNAGMRASGAAIANTTYHIFLIKRPDTGVVDIAADTSVTGANIAANTNAAYTLVRRIGSIVRTGGAIKGFVQRGDEFLWKAGVQDVAASNPGTAEVARGTTVPTGVVVDALIRAGAVNTGTGGNVYGLISCLDQDNEVPAFNAAPGMDFGPISASPGSTLVGSARIQVRTNSTTSIRTRISYSDGNVTLYIYTYGWIDRRGRI